MPAITIKGRNVPIQIWAPLDEVDTQVITQLKNVAALPWVAHHVAVMPDVHLGKGATVGSVIAMHGAVAPAAVGVDIGCGMAAVKTQPHGEGSARRSAPAAAGDRERDPGRQDVARRCGLAARARSAARRRSGADGSLRPAGRQGVHRDGGVPDRDAGRRQPLHRGLPRHRGHGLADAALGKPPRRRQARRAPHRDRAPPEPQPGAGGSRSGGVPGGHQRVRRLSPRSLLGAGVRALQPADDAAPARGRGAPVLAARHVRGRRSRATTTTSPRRFTSATRCW